MPCHPKKCRGTWCLSSLVMHGDYFSHRCLAAFHGRRELEGDLTFMKKHYIRRLNFIMSFGMQVTRNRPCLLCVQSSNVIIQILHVSMKTCYSKGTLRYARSNDTSSAHECAIEKGGFIGTTSSNWDKANAIEAGPRKGASIRPSHPA